MCPNKSRSSRLARSLLTLSAIAALGAVVAAPAGAAGGEGEATIAAAAGHDRGRTLSGQGVKLLAAAGAGSKGNTLTLPVSELTPGAQPTVSSAAGLSFKRGKRAVALNDIRFELGAGTLVGKLGGEQMPVFRLGATPILGDGGNTVSLVGGKLQLTTAAAGALKQRLGLRQALTKTGVGTIWLEARAIRAAESKDSGTPASPPAKIDPNPPYEAARAVIGGGTDWGVLASWRGYILGNFGPGSVGSIATAEGATSTGTLSEASSFFSFPAAAGSYAKGLDGNADKLTLHSQGSVKFAKPGHCIVEVKLSDLELTIDGANSGIELDSIYDIDTPAGMSCTDQPAVSTDDVDFATLDVSAVTPIYSAGGKTITWDAIPAKLTAAGAAAFGAGYPEGQSLDPVTISVETE